MSGSEHPHRLLHEREELLGSADLVARLRRLGGTAEVFLTDPELLTDVLRVTRADYKAAETYRWAPGEPLACPITALVGDRDPEATIEEATAWKRHMATASGSSAS